jgi:hypothetical protein
MCLPILSVVIVTVVGVLLLLYGRTRLLRRFGALLGSVPGPGLIWLAGRFLIFSVLDWISHHPPSQGDTLILGQDITLRELLWIPLQDAGFYLCFVLLLVYGILFGSRRASLRRETFGAGLSFDRWLDMGREDGKRGWWAYQVLTMVALVLALPVTGLASYGTMQVFRLSGQTKSVADWLNSSVLVAALIYALAYYIVNSAIALSDQRKERSAD